MLGGFIFLFAPQTITSRFQLTFARVLSFPLRLGRDISLAARAPSGADVVTRRQYDKLLAEHSQLTNHLHNVMQQRDQEHEKGVSLAGLRAVPEWKRMTFVMAGIVTVPDNTENELIIDRGQDDGLTKGQFVLGNNSIIGTISDVSPRRAKVKLITDPTSKIPVKLTRPDNDKLIPVADGLMHGAGDKRAKIPLIPMKTSVEVGDIVYAARKPGLLDVPIIAGRVTRRERDSTKPLLWDITVEPVCDIERLSDVTVIITAK